MDDLIQIGLSEEAHQMISELQEAGHFADLQDGYRAAIAFAAVESLAISETIGTRKNMFHAHAVDPDGDLFYYVRLFRADLKVPKNRALQALADAGTRELYTRWKGGRNPLIE